MPTCIYCREEKPENSFSLEHIIPKSLGGIYAPEAFKTRRACTKCNNDLGQFVDAGFEKSWFVSHWLQMNAMAAFSPEAPTGLPLICMGICQLLPPHLSNDEVCELYLGPFGEQIYWIRPKDELLYWYAGGNPRTTKTIDSRAYFLFSIHSPKNLQLSLLSFQAAFKKRPVRKILCTKTDVPAEQLGFSTPDSLDLNRIDFFSKPHNTLGTQHQRLAININYDLRFLCKLAIGIGYAFVGEAALQGSHANELQKGLRLHPDDAEPLLRGGNWLSNPIDPKANRFISHEHAIALAIFTSPEGIGINLSIGDKQTHSLLAVHKDNLAEFDFSRIGGGLMLLLFPNTRRSIEMPLSNFVAHKLGNQLNPDLAEEERRYAHGATHLKSTSLGTIATSPRLGRIP